MPIKWTPENNELLLYKILETSNVSADVKAISEAWPKDNGDKPTPRAITERLCKIRQSVKARGGLHFSVSSGKTDGKSTPRTPSSTPRKPRVKKSIENGITDRAGTGGKRKRKGANAGQLVKMENSSDKEATGTQNCYINGTFDVRGLYEDEDEEVEESPSKKMVKVEVETISVRGDVNGDAEGEGFADVDAFGEEIAKDEHVYDEDDGDGQFAVHV